MSGRLRLLSVGRPGDPDAAALHDRYAERIRRLGVDYVAEWVRETRPGGRYSDAHVREREAAALRRKLPGKGAVVALDRSGADLDSETLAARLPAWSLPEATFVVGGPLGLDPALVRAADFAWSLSALTLPHELVRPVVAEALYRALTIRRGLPYHK